MFFNGSRRMIAAQRAVSLHAFSRASSGLACFPNSAAAAVWKAREWVVPRLPYIIVYELRTERDELAVIGVFHGAARG
jgi:hypothetical protein